MGVTKQGLNSRAPPILRLEHFSLFSKESKTVASCKSVLQETLCGDRVCVRVLTGSHPEAAVRTVLIGKCIQGERHGELPGLPWGSKPSLNLLDPASTLFPQSWKSWDPPRYFMGKAKRRFTWAFSGYCGNGQTLQAAGGALAIFQD